MSPKIPEARTRTTAAVEGAGLSGIAVHVPPFRVRLEQWCDWTGSDWDKIRKVVGTGFRMLGPGESVYTVAANATLRLIERFDVDPARVRLLALGTESSTDNSAGAIIVKGMVDMALRTRGLSPLSRHCEVPEFKHACLGGIYALKSAVRMLNAEDGDGVAIVVCTDKALYAPGSSGEPTQGAGAVAMLVERRPRLAVVDVAHAGSASEYRAIDFRKPLGPRAGTPLPALALDIPIYNGRYSTQCYLDEISLALDDLYARRRVNPPDYLRSLAAVFMHRPYQRMPETGLALAYLFALAAGSDDDRAALAAHSGAAGLAVADVIAEMRSARHLIQLATRERITDDAFPLTLAVLKAFRPSETYASQVHGKLTLGATAMSELGNLYTGALPAWLAAGLDEAAAIGTPLAGEEILLIGYGSGDAAEAIPAFPVSGWEDAARRIRMASVLEGAIDLSREQYLALRQGNPVPELDQPRSGEFRVERVGVDEEPGFQDAGVEYYRYVP